MSSSKLKNKKRALSTLQDHRQQAHPSYENSYREERVDFHNESRKDSSFHRIPLKQNTSKRNSQSNALQYMNQGQKEQRIEQLYDQNTLKILPQQQRMQHNQYADFIPQNIQCSVVDTTTEIKWKELQEMDEEELYIERLRQQRQKIDEIKGQFVEKVDYYNNLENKLRELAKYKPYFEKYNELKVIMESTLEKLNKKESGYKGLKETINIQKKQLKDIEDKLVDSKKDNIKLLEDIEQRKMQNSQLQNQIRSMVSKDNEMQYQLKISQDKFENLDNLFKCKYLCSLSN